ncbi:MAG: hypothetical protein IH908_09410 [Proteobacteria bacterium]|nr:hypothetical protein [Pseudomonadota bacterium]
MNGTSDKLAVRGWGCTHDLGIAVGHGLEDVGHGTAELPEGAEGILTLFDVSSVEARCDASGKKGASGA